MLNNATVLLPQSVSEAFKEFKNYSPKSRYIAGGTDVILENGILHSDVVLISLNKIEELKHLYVKNNNVHIGASVTMDELEHFLKKEFEENALYDGASKMGSQQIRNVATIGGNICSSLPSADTTGPLIVLGAKLVLTNGSVERIVEISEFILSPRKNILNDGELLKEIIVDTDKFASSAYVKLGRRNALEIALLGSSCAISLDENKICKDIKIALTTSAPTHVRAKEAEAALAGKPLNKENIEAAAKLSLVSAKLRDSFRCSLEYRQQVLPEIVKRSIYTALERGHNIV